MTKIIFGPEVPIMRVTREGSEMFGLLSSVPFQYDANVRLYRIVGVNKWQAVSPELMNDPLYNHLFKAWPETSEEE